MPFGSFRPKRGPNLEQRLRHIEEHLASLSLDPETLAQLLAAGGAGGGGGGSTLRLPLPEAQVKWDPNEGHTHDGTEFEGKQIDHANLTNVLPDQHHARAHTLLNSDSDHSDSATGLTFATGDLIYRNSGSKWTRLAIGTNDYFLRVVAGSPAWVQLAFSMITGAISAAQHGNLTSTAGTTADHDGTLSANARVAVKKNGTLVATRRGVNLIEGSNVTLTVSDDSGNEEVDVTIAQTSVSAATIAVKEGGSVVSGSAATLDFDGNDFNVTESPSGEANVSWQGFTVEEGNTPVATDVKDLDFGAGFDVAASGGEAEIALDLSEVVTGDVAFTGNVSEVQALYGRAIDETTLKSLGAALTYNGSATAHEYQYQDWVLGGWSVGSISGRSTSYTTTPRVGSAGTNINVPFIPHLAGVISGLSVAYEGAVSGSGGSHTIGLFINGTEQVGATVVVTGSSTSGYEHILTGFAGGSFSAGDEIEIRDKRTGTLNNISCQITMFGYWQE